MYSFFVEPHQIHENDKRVIITGDDVNHIVHVLRMKCGEEIAVHGGDEEKEYRCGILEMKEDSVVCEIRFVKTSEAELPSKIYLFQGLPKGDKMELIIQKTVELGVTEIIPVTCKRCVMKLEEKKIDKKLARWNAIAEAAAKQSKRGIIPRIAPPLSFKEALKRAEEMDVRLIPYELAEDMGHTRELLSTVKPGERIAIFIGPEGGFAEEEIELALAAKVEPITLGKRILRTETAGFTTLAWLGYVLEP